MKGIGLSVKWCGKTTIAEQQAGSIVYMNDPEHSSSYISLAQNSPKILLQGATPRLIDEWQDAPETEAYIISETRTILNVMQ